MSIFADLRRWIGGALHRLFPVDTSQDCLTAIQKDAIERNRLASVENCVAARHAATAITDLLAAMEARNNGKN